MNFTVTTTVNGKTETRAFHNHNQIPEMLHLVASRMLSPRLYELEPDQPADITVRIEHEGKWDSRR